MWGSLPTQYLFSPRDLRWSLGSHDICFTNRPRSLFFALGQTLPTYRLHKNPLGGPFQPTINTCISLLSGTYPGLPPQWIHIFPEGRVHQHPTYQLRYFKWGVSRLVLESSTSSSASSSLPPLIIPIFLTGFDKIMHESRTFPRFLPRIYKEVKMTFGSPIPEDKITPFWSNYRDLSSEFHHRQEDLRTHPAAVDLRIKTTKIIRNAMNELRRNDGWPEEDGNAGNPETYRVVGEKEGEVRKGVYEREAT